MPTAVVQEPPVSAGAPVPETRNSRDPATVLVLSLITIFAGILRLHSIGSKAVWFDESMSVEIARLPWSQFVRALWFREANMALYYVLLHFWLRIGSTPGLIRGLSALISVATIPMAHALASRLFGRNTGLLTAWLLAINAYHIRYAQEARSYSLLVFLSALATWLLIKNIQEPASARWGLYTLTCILAVYAQFFGSLVIIVHGLSLLALRDGDAPWREYLRSLRCFAFFMIPIAAFVVHAGPGPLNWIQVVSPSAMFSFFSSFAGNGGPTLLALNMVAVLMAGFAGWSTWRREGRTFETWAFVLVFEGLFVPVLIVLAASMWLPLFVPRYLSPCLLGLVIIVAVGIGKLRTTLLACVLCAAISVASLAGTTSYYHRDFDVNRNDWGGATSFVFEHARPGDGVFFYLNFGRVPFEFYRSQHHPFPQWPEALESATGHELTYRNFVFTNLGEALSSARPAGDRVWLLLVYDTDPDGRPNKASIMARAVYGKERHLIETRTFSGITVLLYARDDTDSDLRSSLDR